MNTYTITTKFVDVNCKACAKTLRGVMCRLTLSRLEEGLGHEGFQCDKCGVKVKRVPAKEPS